MHFPPSPPDQPWRRLLRIALALPLIAAAALAAPASADTDITVEGLYHTAGTGPWKGSTTQPVPAVMALTTPRDV